jgi:hypothetical protein
MVLIFQKNWENSLTIQSSTENIQLVAIRELLFLASFVTKSKKAQISA